jgi:hypothetical protein
MTTKTRSSAAAEREAYAGPSLIALGAKLVLPAGLAASLTLGVQQSPFLFGELLEAFYTALGCLSLAAALMDRRHLRLSVYGSAHEAVALAAAAVLVHAVRLVTG